GTAIAADVRLLKLTVKAREWQVSEGPSPIITASSILREIAMRITHWFWVAALLLLLTGCQKSSQDNGKIGAGVQQRPASDSANPQEREAEIRANLTKLSPEDRKLAEQQRFCAVFTEN